MLTNNFKQLMIGKFGYSGTAREVRVINREGVAKSVQNSEDLYGILTTRFGKQKLSQLEGYAEVNSTTLAFGSGTTEVTKDDIALADMIADADFTIQNQSSTNTANNTDTLGQQILEMTFQYSGTDTKTINEVGLFYRRGTPNVWTAYPLIMFAREVLEQPITINSGDTFTVSMTLG